MPQITEPQRVQRIRELLNELNKVPPEQHEVERVPWSGSEHKYCKVVTIGADEVLLNPDSHRLRAQLQDDPRWVELSKDPLGDEAQKVLAEHIKNSRMVESFEALKESLLKEGQAHPGVMTHKGVLVNANTRAVAFREIEDPSKRYIRVAVLPETAKQSELALLELRLQMQKELKEEYSLTNELLFVEEMHDKHKMPPAQIARDLRYFPDRPKKGEEEVKLRLEMLDLIRQMQKIPADGLKLTFFDQIGLEQLRGLLTRYRPLVDSDRNRARRLLESWLLSVAVGVSNVHSLRRVDDQFVNDFMLPTLEEDEEIGNLAPAIVSNSDTQRGEEAEEIHPLLGGDEQNTNNDASVKRLLNIVTQKDNRVEIPGTKIVLNRDEVKESFRTAVVTGIKDKRREETEADKLEAPIVSVKTAARQLEKALEAVRAVHSDDEFDTRKRKSLGVAFNKLRKKTRDLEAAFEKYSIPTK
ncbi:MAG: hypothetical protein M3R70_10760 [Actinomycetota bacterium]|nr:hypothetical protein [Actinomycetota bacterium]